MNSMNSKQRDTLNTQLNADENPNRENSNSLDVYETLDNTPFLLVCRNNRWNIAFNNRYLTAGFNTKQEAIDALDKEHWDITMHFIISLMEKHQELIEKYGNLNMALAIEKQKILDEFGSLEAALEAWKNEKQGFQKPSFDETPGTDHATDE